MFRILPPSGESSSITSNSYGNTAGIMRRRNDGYIEPAGPRPPSTLRSHLVACLGEFVGTFMFLFFAFTLHMATVSQLAPDKPPTTLVILTICFAYGFFYGFWLLIYALTLPGARPGMFNPAVSFGLVLAGALSVFRALLLLPVQILAGVSAAAVVKAIVPGEMRRVEAHLSPGVTRVQGLFLEMFTTSLVVIMALVVVARTGVLSFMAPLGIGTALFVASFIGIGYTGASMNPVRALGPCAVNASFPEYHWAYWAGPILGALLPGIYYRLMKALGRGTHLQDQDTDTLPSKSGLAVPRGSVQERTRMPPEAPTPPKIRKTTVTQVRSSRSPGERSGSGYAYLEKDDDFEVWGTNGRRSPPRSHYRSSREERRVSSGRHSDMDRYARAREYEEVMH